MKYSLPDVNSDTQFSLRELIAWLTLACIAAATIAYSLKERRNKELPQQQPTSSAPAPKQTKP